MGKSTISMVIFNGKLLNYQRVNFLADDVELERNIQKKWSAVISMGFRNGLGNDRDGLVGKFHMYPFQSLRGPSKGWRQRGGGFHTATEGYRVYCPIITMVTVSRFQHAVSTQTRMMIYLCSWRANHQLN